jgi:hypothetical protein
VDGEEYNKEVVAPWYSRGGGTNKMRAVETILRMGRGG